MKFYETLLDDLKKNMQTTIKLAENSSGLFDDFIFGIQAANNMVRGTAFAISTQFMNIDDKVLQKMSINSELYGDIVYIQSTWASAKDGLIPYFEESILNGTGLSSIYKDTVKDKFLSMFKAPTKPGMEPFHELLKGLTGGSYIQYEENDEGKLITKRETKLQ